MLKIIYADDEIKYRNLVKMFLVSKGYLVLLAENGQEAVDLVLENPDTDLVILDLMMPVMDGFEACKIINTEFSIPVLMLTALGSLKDEIYGINYGADDYIAKPFSLELLQVRVEALVRRNLKNVKRAEKKEGIEFNEINNSVIIKDETISLTLKEFELFKYLFLNKGIILSRYKILDMIWGYDYEGDPRTVDTHIKSLRYKLGVYGEQIITIRTKGYSYKGEKE